MAALHVISPIYLADAAFEIVLIACVVPSRSKHGRKF